MDQHSVEAKTLVHDSAEYRTPGFPNLGFVDTRLDASQRLFSTIQAGYYPLRSNLTTILDTHFVLTAGVCVGTKSSNAIIS
jgi:hypothetical protein